MITFANELLRRENIEKYKSECRMLSLQLFSRLSSRNLLIRFDPQIFSFFLFPIAGLEKNTSECEYEDGFACAFGV